MPPMPNQLMMKDILSPTALEELKVILKEFDKELPPWLLDDPNNMGILLAVWATRKIAMLEEDVRDLRLIIDRLLDKDMLR